jgi:hypothetical protein
VKVNLPHKGTQKITPTKKVKKSEKKVDKYKKPLTFAPSV